MQKKGVRIMKQDEAKEILGKQLELLAEVSKTTAWERTTPGIGRPACCSKIKSFLEKPLTFLLLRYIFIVATVKEANMWLQKKAVLCQKIPKTSCSGLGLTRQL